MKKRLKTLALILSITTFVLLILLAFIVVFLPYLVNLEVIRSQIANKLSKQLHAKVYLKEVRIRLIPRPTIKTKELEIEHQKYSFYLKEGDLILKLVPLFHKRIEVEKCLLSQPVFVKKKGEGPPPVISPQKIFKITGELLPKIPTLTVQIKQGAIIFSSANQKEILFDKIDATLSLQPDFLEFEGKALNPALKNLTFSLRLWPKEELAEGLLRVKHLDLSLFPLLNSYSSITRLKTDINLDLSYRYENQKWLLGFTASAPCFLKEKPNNLIFDCAALVGQATYGSSGLKIEIKDLAMKNPALFASGYFLHENKKAAFDFHIREGDWGAIRKRLLLLLPENRGLKTLCEIVIDGKAKDIHLKSEAPNLKTLFHLDNFSYEGTAENGVIRVPTLNLRLENVSGWASLKKAILKVKKGEGDYQQTHLSNVSLELNLRKLKDKTSPLIFEADFKTNFNDLRKILGALPLPAKINEELNNLNGTGKLFGQVKIGGLLKKPIVSFSFTPANLSLKYAHFPLPAVLNDGLVTYKAHTLSVKGIEISFPKSKIFTSFSLNISKKPYFFTLSEARGTIFIPELKKILHSYPKGEEILNRYPFDGEWIDLIYASYKGLLEEKSLVQNFSLKAQTTNFKISMTYLPGPLFFKRATVIYDKYSLAFENSEANLLDAHFLGAGEIDFKPLSLYLRGEGQSGKDFISWIYKKGKIPDKFFPVTPIKASSLKFKMALPKITFNGQLINHKNVKASFNFEKDKNYWKIKSIIYPSASSPINIQIEKNYMWNIAFNGHLTQDQIKQFFLKNPFVLKKISGDFTAKINAKELTRSQFTGTLKVSGFKWPTKPNIWIEELDVKARKKNVKIKHLEADIGDTTIEAKGNLYFDPNFINFEGKVYSPFIVLDDILSLRKRNSNKNSKIKLVGTVDFEVDSLVYKNFELSLVTGTLFYYPEKIRVVVNQANLCGIKFWGDYEKSLKARKLKVFFKRQNGELAKTLFCLFHQKKFEGPYNLKGNLLTSGHKALFEKSSGEINFISKKGRIHQFGLLSKLLAFLSPIDIFQGNLPNLGEEGLTYNLLKLDGRFQKKYLEIENLELNAPGFRFFATGKIDILNKKINLTALVSPFKTVDTVVSNVPLVGWVLTGKSKMIVGVPIRISGKLEDPSIIPLDPTTLGSHFLGIVGRTFKLPFKILFPGKK